MTDPTTHHHHRVATTEPGHGDDAHEGHEGHDTRHDDHMGQFRRLFWINLVIAIPVVALSPLSAMLLGYSVPGWAGWVAGVLGTVAYAWGGTPFLTGTVSKLKSRRTGMMLPITLGITLALLASWAATLGLVHHELEFWWELALLIVIMLLGHWIEMRSLAQTTSVLDSLAALLPDEAEHVEGDDVVKIDSAGLGVGSVVDGRADMDESMITGESRPVARRGRRRDRVGTGDPRRRSPAAREDRTGRDRHGRHLTGRGCDHPARSAEPPGGRRPQARRRGPPGKLSASTASSQASAPPIGLILPMPVGAILMSISTVVALNAQLLRRIDLTPDASTRSVLERQK